MGSKSRIAKHIVPIIQQYIDSQKVGTYVEPFCGGCNVIDKIACGTKIAADNHSHLISLYKSIGRINELPAFITKEHYSDVRNCFNNGTNEYEDWYIGAIGFLASYNGRFFDGGYAGLVNTKAGTIRNYYDEAKRNLEEQVHSLCGIEFICSDYLSLPIKHGSVVYCDPPYKNVKQYGSSKGFSHEVFWDWVRGISKDNFVIVSEHQAPSDFKCLWELPVTRTIDNNKRLVVTERLFTLSEAV